MAVLNMQIILKDKLAQATDDALLRQISCGCKESFNALFNLHWEKAYADAFKRIADTDIAKDIVQDVFVHIWVKRETLKILNLPAYLNIAIRNKVFKHLEKQSNHIPFFDALENIPSDYSNGERNLLTKELTSFYETWVNNLPDKGQNIFRLHYEQDLPTKDIAAKLGISRKTVQNQLLKAVKKLKVSITPLFSLLIFLFNVV
ncbi:hypothetical protein A0256_07390 [Mucilaginibacter sp. PAMC 26640]|nr:hypothetical protein A0256_07390 [Mucilaginibacter sp. PAMC 26640]